MTAAADVRNSLLARKAEERQYVLPTVNLIYLLIGFVGYRNAALEREKHVKELLRVTEWRSKAGVGAFPTVQRAGELPSRESLQFYLTPFPEYVNSLFIVSFANVL